MSPQQIINPTSMFVPPSILNVYAQKAIYMWCFIKLKSGYTCKERIIGKYVEFTNSSHQAAEAHNLLKMKYNQVTK
jgi:hypothetical protein